MVLMKAIALTRIQVPVVLKMQILVKGRLNSVWLKIIDRPSKLFAPVNLILPIAIALTRIHIDAAAAIDRQIQN